MRVICMIFWWSMCEVWNSYAHGHKGNREREVKRKIYIPNLGGGRICIYGETLKFNWCQ
jgi:hypothetical protein